MIPVRLLRFYWTSHSGSTQPELMGARHCFGTIPQCLRLKSRLWAASRASYDRNHNSHSVRAGGRSAEGYSGATSVAGPSHGPKPCRTPLELTLTGMRQSLRYHNLTPHSKYSTVVLMIEQVAAACSPAELRGAGSYHFSLTPCPSTIRAGLFVMIYSRPSSLLNRHFYQRHSPLAVRDRVRSARRGHTLQRFTAHLLGELAEVNRKGNPSAQLVIASPRTLRAKQSPFTLGWSSTRAS